ncbi:MAG: aspartate kinase [Candidatus Bathyarchaeia archaeon]
MGGGAVIKFGGADLSTGGRIRKAAEMVVKSGYREVVVVVSAMGKTTDQLVEIISNLGASDRDYADIISMGERTSARIFCSALRSLGAKAVYFDPAQENWPIITDSNFRDAEPDVEATRALVKRHLRPLLGEAIPVVCGFLGRDGYGNITTLGRGGSDITALLLANCLEADEVVLVKDTPGVLSADPNIVPDAKPFDRLDIHEMFALAQGGARIVRPEALRYKLLTQRLRIASFSSESLASGGTEITGIFNLNSAEMVKHRSLSAITVVGEITPENLSELFSMLRGKPVFGVSTGQKSVTVFAQLKSSKEVVKELHDLQRFKAISHQDGVGVVEITHPAFVESPGWVAKITSALAARNINIIEVTTSKATINIFVNEEKLEDTFKAAGDVFAT